MIQRPDLRPKSCPWPSARLSLPQGLGVREPVPCGTIETTKKAKESLRAWSQPLDVAIDSSSRGRQLTKAACVSLATASPGA